MKRFQKIYLTLGTVGALLAFSGCSDEIQTPDYNKEGITGISLHIPDVDGAAQFGRTRGEEFITRAGEAAAEGKINEIWLFAYSTTDPNNKVIEPLSLDNMTVVSNTYRKANIELRPDTYKFYVVANLSNYLPTGKLSSTLSESDLKGLVLNFDKDSKELSLNNGLPMACMNDKIKVGNDVASATVVTSGEVEIGAGACPKLVADMTFLCSKVRYTILHDRESFSSAFGQSEFDVTGSKVANISNATKWNGATGSDYSAPFDLSLDSPLEKVYPTDLAQLKSDGMELTAFSGTKDVKGKQRAWQQTVYLPENLSTSKKSKLTISTTTNDIESSYELVLNDKASDDQSKLLERGHFYDIIIEAASRDVFDLSNITVSEWTTENLVADFTHTYLTLAQTENIEVKSLEPFELVYQTDGTGSLSRISCKEQMNGAAIITYKRDANKPNSLILQINPNIMVADVAAEDRTGVANIEIWAGNIKKTVKVRYDMSPVFIVTPTERTIQFAPGGDNQTEFHFITNLGGVKLKKLSDTSYPTSYPQTSSQGSNEYLSKLNYYFSGNDNKVPEDYIVMKETTPNGPKTSSVHTFMVEAMNIPAGENISDYQKVLTVTVQPKLNDYRIYFRSINDYFQTLVNRVNDTSGKQEEYLAARGYTMPTEAEPWIDFWDENGKNEKNEYNHRVYIYNQSNNNSTWNDLGHDVRQFTNWSNDENDWHNKMTGDDNNPGWYYRDLPTGEHGWYDGEASNDFKTKPEFEEYKHPLPGMTLMIFHNNLKTNNSVRGEYIAHRCASSNDPGVPLFSYADKEGWYVYDPTRDPVFNCYDDKPIIEDVTYTIYSKSRMTGWYKRYGRWRDVANYRIEIWANKWDGGGDKMNQPKTINGQTYYVNYLQFKAPRGEYDKTIIIKFEGGKESMLFGGEIFKNNAGYFNGSSWTENIPK